MAQQEKVKEFYATDLVYRFDKCKKIILGSVVDSYEGSSEDVDDMYALRKGQIRVSWSNSSREQTWRESKVRLMNRSISPGSIVRRLEKGKETQRGYCKVNKQIVTVQIIGTDKVIEHVDSERLQNVRPFNIDDAVCMGNKYGRIEHIDQMIQMQSIDGSIVEVLTSINTEVEDYWLSKRNRQPLDIYYPGQEVICIPANLEQPNWINKTKAMKRNMHQRLWCRFTVQKVTDMVLEVAFYGSNGYLHLSEISGEEPKKLIPLEHLSDTCLELLERKLLKLGSHDVLLKKKDWTRKMSLMYRPEVPKVRHIVSNSKTTSKVQRLGSWSLLQPTTPTDVEQNEAPIFPNIQDPEDEWWTEEGEDSDVEADSGASSQSPSIVGSKKMPKKKHYPPKPCELNAGHTLPVEIICIESKVTVVWQDGTEEKDIPSTQLYYSVSLDDHEFFPGEWVIRENSKNELPDESGQYGVVQKVDYIERTATIKWFNYLAKEKKPQYVNTEELSVYDLKKHAKFVFKPKSIVKGKAGQEGKIGSVVDSCIEGYVIVKWMGGAQENCWPQDIELIPDMADYDYSDPGDSEEDKASWETESIESCVGSDLTNETALQTMAARLDFVRSRLMYLRDAFVSQTFPETFGILKDLLIVYENSSYLDKLLGTSYFSLRSKHFQVLIMKAKEEAQSQNIELRGRLFNNELGISVSKLKNAESENMKKMLKLESKIKEIEKSKEGGVGGAPSTTVPATPETPDGGEAPLFNQSKGLDGLCLELASTLIKRMDLAYAEIISRIGGKQALSVMTKTMESSPANSTPMPSFPATPDDSFSVLTPLKLKKPEKEAPEQTLLEITPPIGETEWYNAVEEAPQTHHYYNTQFEPDNVQKFLKAVMKEYKLLRDSLPSNVWVRSYSDRIDLLSVMIRGPAKTPYEDGLFLFDIQLSADYPRSPPLVYYISYSSERLNPNLYVEGKVCVSLLGTWMGKGTEVWGPDSTLLQLIVSIQGLILVAEPYYNEAGYERQTDTQQGYENSRTYNELVILKLVQSMTELLKNPPEVFRKEIVSHFKQNGEKLCNRLEKFCSDQDPIKPGFPLLPVSKGLKLSLNAALKQFRQVLAIKTVVTNDVD
ncbi:(E3-independent) E2 ubiquitin-conjugating enzyme UBE2O isoform X2 [Anthonomus grandis grandis]|uniref:(E3-independent) E2 ubiquitin-conjugating enzyme UBE2O isoform X2 n=1 Tax=Anthonomus grandis grandis TaxID=2921223 RepID=UPI00216640A0|nr:(E3-independent) E2 ubiquitin-conjugating enzyme UBE2O isoform X2 [Anthonomus grandis grandis]